ncbi:hypothetical protein ACFX13_000724 [Malus domestica]
MLTLSAFGLRRSLKEKKNAITFKLWGKRFYRLKSSTPLADKSFVRAVSTLDILLYARVASFPDPKIGSLASFQASLNLTSEQNLQPP